MNQKHLIGVLCSLIACGSASAGCNPASKKYVDEKVGTLQSQLSVQITNILTQIANFTSGVTTAGANISVTGDGSNVSPYVVSNIMRMPGEAQDGGIIFAVNPDGQSGLVAATANEPGGAVYTWQQAIDVCANKAGGGWFLPSNTQTRLLMNNSYYLDPSDPFGGFSVAIYWTSTTDSTAPTFGWSYNSGFGSLNSRLKTNVSSVRCIRNF